MHTPSRVTTSAKMSTPKAGWETPYVLETFAKWLACALLYTCACAFALPRRAFHESPLYNWLSCLPIQLVALPYVLYRCLAVYDGGVAGWLVAPWSDLDGAWERYYLLLIFSYMFKDVGMYLFEGGGMAPMYWAHHVLCWAIIFQFFYNDTVGAFIAGATAMEVGGAAQTLHLLSEDSRLSDAVHVVVMSVSNVAAVVTSSVFASAPVAPLVQRLAIWGGVFVLAYQRQTYAMSVHRDHVGRRKSA